MFQKSFEFDEVGILRLLINLPDEWLPRPVCAHKRIFSSHKIEVATRQQSIVVFLTKEGDGL